VAIAALGSQLYADPTSLNGLKREAAAQSPEALREVAKQFESLFTTMMLKSMRDATPQDSLFGSEQQDFYQDMFDQQLSVQLSKGKGLGLADVLVKQLMQGQPVPAATASVAGNWPPRNRDEFVQRLMPAATEAGRKLGVDPTTVLAHAALETGWGKSMPIDATGQPSFNLFGIKAGARWGGATAASATHEYEAGSMRGVTADFRAYNSPEASLHDYADFLRGNPRYAGALNTGSDITSFANALKQGGYATDPDYANKLRAVANELKSRFVSPLTASAV
jgi:peptidoglycan hydrolase FlgJ